MLEMGLCIDGMKIQKRWWSCDDLIQINHGLSLGPYLRVDVPSVTKQVLRDKNL